MKALKENNNKRKQSQNKQTIKIQMENTDIKGAYSPLLRI